MKFDDLKYLTVQLPEGILREKWSGNFDKVRQMIAYKMTQDIPTALKARLELELKNLDNFESCYSITKEEAFQMVKEHISDLTMEEFERFQIEGKIDSIYLNGKEMFLNSFCDSLLKSYPKLWSRMAPKEGNHYQIIDDMIEGLEDGEETTSHIHIRQELEISPAAVKAGEKIRVHMPLPLEDDNVSNLQVMSIWPKAKQMPIEGQFQPTVYFEEIATENQIFSLEYSLDHRTKYSDLSKVDLKANQYEQIPDEAKQYLGEEYPHICFTPYLKSMAKEIKGDEKNPLTISRAIYDYITTKTKYWFVRDYASIDNLPEYCALNQVGDCGVEALLFITLCRLSGIPARWVSGLDAKPGDVGEHDWAQFYIGGLGWLDVDLSYGVTSYLLGAMKRWNYYFGNTDPFRIPINKGFQKDLVPAKKFMRLDPYDNQCGEVETNEHGVYGDDLIYRYVEKDIHLI